MVHKNLILDPQKSQFMLCRILIRALLCCAAFITCLALFYTIKLHKKLLMYTIVISILLILFLVFEVFYDFY